MLASKHPTYVDSWVPVAIFQYIFQHTKMVTVYQTDVVYIDYNFTF